MLLVLLSLDFYNIYVLITFIAYRVMPQGIVVDHRKTDAINYKPYPPNVK